MLKLKARGIEIEIPQGKIVEEAHLQQMAENVIDILESDRQEVYAWTTTGDAFVTAIRDLDTRTIEVFVTRIQGSGFKREPRGVAVL